MKVKNLFVLFIVLNLSSAISAAPPIEKNRTALVNNLDDQEVVFVEPQYRVTQEAQVAFEPAAVPMSVVMSSFPQSNVLMTICSTTNGTVELEVSWPIGFTNGLDIFAATDLNENIWEVIHTGISTVGETHYPWMDQTSTTTPTRFYRANNADLDTDKDGLSDGLEWFVYGSDPKLKDTDGDGLNDAVEVGALPPTDPSNIDRQVPVISITLSENNSVVVP